jgi:hypothetical protein
MAEPESFSVKNAELAANETFEALSKPKQREYLGNLNEVLVVIRDLTQKAGITDTNKRVA